LSFSKFFYFSPIAQAIIRLRDRKYIDANEGFLSLFGYSKNDIAGHVSPSFGLFQENERREALYRTLRQKGRLRDFEAELNTKSHERRWIRISGNPIELDGDECILFSFIDFTELRKAELELRRADEDLRRALDRAEEGDRILKALMEYVPEGISIADAPDIRLRMISRYGEYLLGGSHSGLTAGEVAAQWKVFYKDGKTPMPEEELPLTRAIRRGETVRDMEIVELSATGRQLNLLCNAAPILDSTGAIAGGVITWQEISDRKAAENAVHAREAMMNAFFDASPGILNLFDDQLRFIKSDPVTPTYFGLDQNSIVGKSVFDLNPVFGRETLGEISRRVIQTGKPELNQLVSGPVPGKGGEIGWFLASFFPVPLPDGKSGIGAMAVEVTEIKRAEEVMRESEERFRTYAEAMPQGAFIADPEGNINYFNQRFYDYIGIKDKIGSWDWKILPMVHPDDLQRTIETWEHSLKTGDSYNIVYRLRRSDGQYRWHLGRAIAIRDSNGRVIQWLGTNTDIHDQKEAEQKLQEALRVRDEFLSMASHELKTPLTTISLQVQNQQRIVNEAKPEKMPVEQLRKTSSLIAKQIGRLTALVNDLLDISRISAGRLTLNREPLSLSEVLRQIVEIESQGLAFAHMPLSLEIPENVMVDADRLRVEQVVGNLISNAIKYAPGKPLSISLKMCGNKARLEVKDQGPGISLENRKRIFERYERAVADPAVISGLGLGLHISKQIVKAHGGDIWVDSTPGQGARFVVELPLARSAVKDKAA